jgi:membrane protein
MNKMTLAFFQPFFAFWTAFQEVDWRRLGSDLLVRLQREHLAKTAGSLTFTSTMALVPFLTVILAVFTVFPLFKQFQQVLEHWLVQSLIPESISRQVLGYLTQFSSKASRLGWVGFAVLVVSALSLVYTIDKSLNAIWHNHQKRALPQRILLYWSVMTLGPLVLGLGVVSLFYVSTLSRTWIGEGFGLLEWLINSLEFFMWVLGMSALYRYVPNTPVKYSHALMGGLWVTTATEVARHALTWYLKSIPAVSMIYGAFATLPIFLLWMYLTWLIILSGAVFVSALPSLSGPVIRDSEVPGFGFQVALESLAALAHWRERPGKGLDRLGLARALRVDPLVLEEVMGHLIELDWVATLDEEALRQPRWVILIDPARTPVLPLLSRFLLREEALSAPVYQAWGRVSLQEAFGRAAQTSPIEGLASAAP